MHSTFFYVDSGVQLHMALEVLSERGYRFSQNVLIETRSKKDVCRKTERVLIRIFPSKDQSLPSPYTALKGKNIYLDTVNDEKDWHEVNDCLTAPRRFKSKDGSWVNLCPAPLTNNLLPLYPRETPEEPDYAVGCIARIEDYIDRQLQKNSTRALAELSLMLFVHRPDNLLQTFRLGSYGFVAKGSAQPLLTTIAGLLAANRADAYWLLERIGRVELCDGQQVVEGLYGLGLVGAFQNNLQQETAWLFGVTNGQPEIDRDSRVTVNKATPAGLAFGLLSEGKTYQEYEKFGMRMAMVIPAGH
jgi:hypothetical protein